MSEFAPLVAGHRTATVVSRPGDSVRCRRPDEIPTGRRCARGFLATIAAGVLTVPVPTGAGVSPPDWSQKTGKFRQVVDSGQKTRSTGSVREKADFESSVHYTLWHALSRGYLVNPSPTKLGGDSKKPGHSSPFMLQLFDIDCDCISGTRPNS